MPDLPDITVQPEDRGTLRGANLHRARFDADELVFVAGVAVLNPARTAVDLARQSGVLAGVVAMDHVLNRGIATESDIATVLKRCWNWPGIRRASRAFLLTDSRAESPLESLSRIALNRMALPRSVPQQVLRDERGLVVARTDFGWADCGVAGEADGMSKYETRDVLRAEKARQETLEQLGLVVVRWNWNDITRKPRQVEARLLDGFRRAAALQRSGSPRYWSV